MTAILEEHKQAKEALLNRFRVIAEIAEHIGMRTLASDVLTSRIPKLEGERFHLVVLGEFNHGKSTFVNALLGADVLPTGITPTTAALNHVVFADEPRASAVTREGERIELSPDDLASWVTVAGGRSSEVNLVEVGYPAEILRENITLVDTPGVNDLNEQRAEITYGYVPRADAVIFLLDAGQALKDSEREFLSSHVLESAKDRLVFVLGKVDLLADAERDAVLDYVDKGLRKFVDEPVIFSVSAKRWLEGDDPGFAELLSYLDRFLDEDRGRVVLDNAAADAQRTAAYVRQNLGLKLHAYDLDVGELETRVESVRSQLNASKRTLDELHDRIKADSSAIKAQVKLDLDGFARAFVDALPGQIDAVDADDVKTYLGPFIEDKFREWAELEGAKVASLLEKLAEDVIAVTNENVAAASSSLASRLGPAETEVEIDVDSFKYDVGIYAVGTLGTAVFLFGSMLAGGLLTLTTPILAIILKSKISGDIREQAKERVPAVVLRAAGAMGPHFDSCIDDFATRLSGFVTAAGNTLYKGISEILDQTITERREAEEEIDVLRDKTREQVRAMDECRAELEELRTSIWKPHEPAGEGDEPGED